MNKKFDIYIDILPEDSEDPDEEIEDPDEEIEEVAISIIDEGCLKMLGELGAGKLNNEKLIIKPGFQRFSLPLNHAKKLGQCFLGKGLVITLAPIEYRDSIITLEEATEIAEGEVRLRKKDFERGKSTKHNWTDIVLSNGNAIGALFYWCFSCTPIRVRNKDEEAPIREGISFAVHKLDGKIIQERDFFTLIEDMTIS